MLRVDPRAKTDWLNRILCSSVPKEDLSETPCPVCRSNERRLLITERGYPLWKCLACTHVYISPRPSERWLGELYSSTYMPDSENEQDWEQYLDGVFESTARAIAAYQPQRGDLLDVGTGFGGFLVRAEKDGWRLHGIEPNESAFAVAQQRLGNRAQLQKSIFETAELQPESFDGIIMMNVIEHVRDPLAICERAFQLLRPGGFLGLRWPQMATTNLLRHRLRGSRESNRAIIGAPVHLHDYTRASMERLFTNTGYHDLRHAWAGTRRQPHLGFKARIAAGLTTAVAQATHLFSGGRLITPVIARLTLGRKPA